MISLREKKDSELNIGDIVALHNYNNTLVIGVYLGYLERDLDSIYTRKFDISVIDIGIEETLNSIVNSMYKNMYVLCTVEVENYVIANKVVDITKVLLDSDITLNYILEKRKAIFNTSFNINRLVSNLVFENIEKVEGIEVVKREDLNKWFLKTLVSENIRINCYNTEEIHEILKKYIELKFKDLRQVYYSYKDYVTNCERVTDENELMIGRVYLCNRVSKRGKSSKQVLMLYLGNDKWVQIGKSTEFKDKEAIIIHNVIDCVRDTYFLDELLTAHHIVSLSCTSEIYKLNTEIELSRPQYVKRINMNKLYDKDFEEFNERYLCK